MRFSRFRLHLLAVGNLLAHSRPFPLFFGTRNSSSLLDWETAALAQLHHRYPVAAMAAAVAMLQESVAAVVGCYYRPRPS
jgi:hypothetical protein